MDCKALKAPPIHLPDQIERRVRERTCPLGAPRIAVQPRFELEALRVQIIPDLLS